MALSIGIRNSISLLSAIQATRSLTITLVGLSPTEHTSFFLDTLPEGRISRFRFWPWHVSPRDLSETGDAQALARIRPNPFRFTSRLVLKLWLLRLTSLTILGPPSAQSSFACHQRYSWQGGVQHHLEGHCPFFIAPTSSCAKPAPSSGFVYPHLFPAVLAGRCEPLLGTGSSRRYLRNSFLRCLVLNPDGPTECTCLFLPRRHRPSLGPSQVGFPLLPRTRFSAVRFRGCRRTFLRSSLRVYLSPKSLPPLPISQGGRDLYFRAERASLPLHAPDMLSVRYRQLTEKGLSPFQICGLVGRSKGPPSSSIQHDACASS